MKIFEVVKTSCPRTKASACQCESVNKVTEAEETVTAVCVLEHSDTVEGIILFKQQANGPTLIVGKITGLEPGEHGFHIHEFGDLSQGCESAGGHYNPDGVDHGDLEQGHVGDLGNITADEDGVANISIAAKRVDLTGERSVVGRAVVVHSDQDDLGQGGDDESLKTGNAGDRLACGVITLKETVKESIYETAGEIASASEIYVDMDGVLADFFGEWAKLMNVDHFTDIDKQHDINDALQKIRDTDDFWLRLPVLPQAKELLNLIKQVKGEYYICTSPLADDPNSERHKRTWVEENLAFFPPKEVYVTHNKPQYAKQEDGTPNILIDDYGKNIAAWEAAGGIGFKHKDHKFERTAKAIKQHMQEPVEENFAEDKVNYTMPNFDFEWEEANRYEQYRKIGKEEWIKLAKTGKVVDVDNRMANDIENTEAGEEYRDDHWDGLVKAKRDRFAKALSSGQIELPIIARYSDGQLELISGNTRLTGMMRELGRAKAWIYDVPDEIADLEENFADGKKKGKSRPGRVKRSGASCNGSVTDLRKRAKNASGEKAKMYHWCANMKSGKKK